MTQAEEKMKHRADLAWESPDCPTLETTGYDNFTAIYSYGFKAALELPEVQALERALEIAHNACGVAATLLEFHGRPSRELNSCIENMRNQDLMGQEALTAWRKFVGEEK